MRIDGLDYAGWTEVEVVRSLGQATPTYRLEIAEAPGIALPFAPFPRVREGDACQIFLGRSIAVTGYVDVVEPSFDKNSHGLSVTGRGRASDIVDSSAKVSPGQFRGYRFDAIASRLLSDFDIPIIMRGDVGKPFANVQITPGETVWEVLDRLAAQRGLLIHEDDGGSVVVETIRDGDAIASLTEGGNILSGQATWRADTRFSEYQVNAQRPASDQAYGAQASQRSAKVKDTAVRRHRPLLIQAEEPGDDQDARNRANWEAATRAGESIEATISTTGWHHLAGLWSPGDVIYCHSPTLRLAQNLVAASVTSRQSRGQGSVTEIQLKPAAALNADPSEGGGEEGDAWGQVKPTEEAR